MFSGIKVLVFEFNYIFKLPAISLSFPVHAAILEILKYSYK